MAIRCIRIYVSTIQIICVLIITKFYVSSLCFEDVSFFIGSSQACAFGQVEFDKIFNGTTKRCQIDCTILSTVPPYFYMKEVYTFRKIEIYLVSYSHRFVMEKPCRNIFNNFYIVIGCEGEFIQNRGIGDGCVSDNQCTSFTINSTCNETSRLCQCKTGHLYMLESNTCSPVKRETYKTEQHSGLVIGVGVAGLMLGVAICGLLNFILTHYKKKCQIRCNKEIREQASVQVSCSLNPEQFDNRQGNNDMEGFGVYNHLHEPVNISVQPDYDHVPQHDVDDDYYSHIKTCNANQVASSGEYGVIS